MALSVGARLALLSALFSPLRTSAIRDRFEDDRNLDADDESPPQQPASGSEPTNSTARAVGLLQTTGVGCPVLAINRRCDTYEDVVRTGATDEAYCRLLCEAASSKCCEWSRQSQDCIGSSTSGTSDLEGVGFEFAGYAGNCVEGGKSTEGLRWADEDLAIAVVRKEGFTSAGIGAEVKQRGGFDALVVTSIDAGGPVAAHNARWPDKAVLKGFWIVGVNAKESNADSVNALRVKLDDLRQELSGRADAWIIPLKYDDDAPQEDAQ